jgi:O-acetylserine/cysteine efflux transporter
LAARKVSRGRALRILHLFFALVVTASWGFNFVFIRLGLDGIPPFLLCALRFLFSGLPLVFYFPRPRGSWKILIAYGLVMFVLQFSFLFGSIAAGMTPAMASLLAQTQVFFSLALAAVVLREKLGIWKWIGAAVASLGILVVLYHLEGGITLLSLGLVLAGAFSWSVGNMISKKMDFDHALSLVVWGSLIASPVLFLLSFYFEGSPLKYFPLSGKVWLAIAYIVLVSTHLGYSLWSFLLKKYPASTVAPFTLLVPGFGYFGAWLVLDEPFPIWKFFSGAFVIVGLALTFVPNFRRQFPGRR